VISITSLEFLPDLFMVFNFGSVTVSEAGNKSSIKFCYSLSLIEIRAYMQNIVAVDHFE
jgi:hypothetical protein